MVISFKNVGRLKEERLIERSEEPIGIVTPINTSSRFGLFNMHTRVLDVINDNLKNLLLTNYGERVMFPDFGANLKSLLFEQEGPDLEESIARNIMTSVEKYMPFINLQDLDIEFEKDAYDNTTNLAIVKITYNVEGINDKTLALELGVKP